MINLKLTDLSLYAFSIIDVPIHREMKAKLDSTVYAGPAAWSAMPGGRVCRFYFKWPTFCYSYVDLMQ